MARNQGWTEDELSEALLHLGGYIGLPSVREATADGQGSLPRDAQRRRSSMMLMTTSDLPLERIARGKVRDVYAVDADRLLLVATDRVSAYDVVMAEPIPQKGAVLTQVSAWWFRQLGDVVKHHMISADAGEIAAAVPALKPHRAAIAGRAMLCRRGTVFPIECVVRGYHHRLGVARICQEPARWPARRCRRA